MAIVNFSPDRFLYEQDMKELHRRSEQQHRELARLAQEADRWKGQAAPPPKAPSRGGIEEDNPYMVEAFKKKAPDAAPASTPRSKLLLVL